MSTDGNKEARANAVVEKSSLILGICIPSTDIEIKLECLERRFMGRQTVRIEGKPRANARQEKERENMLPPNANAALDSATCRVASFLQFNS